MNRLRNIFIIRFHNILRLISIHLPMIALKCLFMVPMNYSWSQNVFCKRLSGNFTIARWVPHKRVDLRRKDMQKIISPLVILHYYQLFQPKVRRCLHVTRSFVVLSAAYLTKVLIHHYYNGAIVIWVILTI